VSLSDLLPRDLGDGLVLHATTAADADDAYAAVDADRDRLREWLPWVDATASVEIEREYLSAIEVANQTGTGLHVTLRQDEAFAGFVGLRLDTMHPNGEVGYWVAAGCAGRGLITRSVAAIIDFGFGPLELHRIQLNASTRNVRSRAVAERLGMTHEGTLREAELLAQGRVDLEVYAVLSTEWPTSRR
jgi:ribosomal-protein-serine acetyltransferase